MKRFEVYQMIDTERAYQDRRWGDTGSSETAGKGERTIDEFILYAAGYMADAVHQASHFGDPAAKLAALRKVAGLCVACFEQHGCHPRV